jgi:hypothetical protein
MPASLSPSPATVTCVPSTASSRTAAALSHVGGQREERDSHRPQRLLFPGLRQPVAELPQDDQPAGDLDNGVQTEADEGHRPGDDASGDGDDRLDEVVVPRKLAGRQGCRRNQRYGLRQRRRHGRDDVRTGDDRADEHQGRRVRPDAPSADDGPPPRVEMAATEAADGKNRGAIAMAETIRDTQKAGIAEMQQLLTELGG